MTRTVFVALAVAAAIPARAGIVLQFEDDQKKLTTVEMDGKKLRSQSQSNDERQHATIFDGDKQVFYQVDDEKKTYQRMDQDSGSAMAKRMKDAMEQAKAKMTPEQRAQMESFMARQQSKAPQAAPAEHKWKFERASGGQKVAGYSCDNYRVLRDGKLNSEVCFVPWSAGAFRKDDFVAFQEMSRFLEKTFASMNESLGRGARPSRSDEWVSHFVDSAPGFPAVMDRLDDGGARTREMRLVKVERTSVAASRFAPPAGYRQRELMGGRDED